MSRENLNEILQYYEKLKEYTSTLGDERLNELIFDFEEKFIPYLRRDSEELVVSKYDSMLLKKGEKTMKQKVGIKSFLKCAFLGINDRPENVRVVRKGNSIKSFLKHAFLGIDDRKEKINREPERN